MGLKEPYIIMLLLLYYIILLLTVVYLLFLFQTGQELQQLFVWSLKGHMIEEMLPSGGCLEVCTKVFLRVSEGLGQKMSTSLDVYRVEYHSDCLHWTDGCGRMLVDGAHPADGVAVRNASIAPNTKMVRWSTLTT